MLKMSISNQDDYYLNHEGDSFFSRNFEGKDVPTLRENKHTILQFIMDSGIQFDHVLEFGCNYGDLLNYFSEQLGKRAAGVEASRKAVDFGRRLYGGRVDLYHGTIADNALSSNSESEESFDFVIADDVLGWVSREQILQSVANIDRSLKDQGYLFLRDFRPNKCTKNRNHHVLDTDIYNFKVPGSHAKLFLATGMYEVVLEKVYYDNTVMSAGYRCDNPFNYRWGDVILQKKKLDYFDEVKMGSSAA